MIPAFVFGHGIGGASDLPVPLGLTVLAGTTALLFSFAILTLAWQRSRYHQAARERLAPQLVSRVVDSPATSWGVRLLGLTFFGYVTWAMVAGPDLTINPSVGVFYVIVWVGVIPVSLTLGPIVRLLSPLRTLHRLLCSTIRIPRTGLVEYPHRLGYWPAALGLGAFAWQELVNPDSVFVSSIQWWLIGYAITLLLGSAVFGETWFARADPFEVFGTFVSKASVWARDEQGRLVLRSPLANLGQVEARPGMAAVVSVLLGSTAFDSFAETLTWYDISQRLHLGSTLLNSLGLLGFVVVVAASLTLGSLALASTAARQDPTLYTSSPHQTEPNSPGLPNTYAMSLIPIVVGYFVAHYLTFFYVRGQETVIQLSDPLSRGDNLLGTADWSLNYGLSDYPTTLATIKVLAVVVGHIMGAVVAHDMTLSRLPQHLGRGGAFLAQLPMMLVMLTYTYLGLFLLFSA